MSDTTRARELSLGTEGDTAVVSLEVSEPVEEPNPAVPTAGFVGKSPARLAWLRLRRDRTGLMFGLIVATYVLVAIFAPLISAIYGQKPTTGHSELLSTTGQPIGYLGGITFNTKNPSHQIHILGVEPQSGRDIFMQLVYGARTSLGIAFAASIIALIVGVVIGIVSAYLGGWVDAAISWFIDFMLAFPFLLFAIAAIPVVNSRLADERGYVSVPERVTTIIVIFALFSWMATARLVRGQVLSLREREYVEAAKAAGAATFHILFRQILPNLWAPILVTFALSVPATVTGEASLSFLNIGVVEPTPDWGRMIGNSIAWLQGDPTYTLIPIFSIFMLVLSFNLFGDSVRDALDPKSNR